MLGKGGGQGNRLFIANLSFDTGWKELKDHCRKEVDILWVHMLNDPKTGKSTGRAVVELADGRDLEMAIRTLHDTDLDGRDRLGPGGSRTLVAGGKGWRKERQGRGREKLPEDVWRQLGRPQRARGGPLPMELLGDGRAGRRLAAGRPGMG